MAEDRIYAMPLDRVGDFEFDDRVVDVFPDMISRSVPGYASVLAMTAELAERYATPGSVIYDLGCSLGATSLLMRTRVPGDCTIKAVDSSPAMVAKLRGLLVKEALPACELEVIEDDVRRVAIANTSFAVLNFTLQFVPIDGRKSLLQRIYDGMNNGGALVLSEKVHFSCSDRQQLMTDLHHAFKRANGYSDLEIAQKRTALENTLTTETILQHEDRLQEVGFRVVTVWFQCFNFVSILAVK